MKFKVQNEEVIKPLNWGEMVEAHLAGAPIPDPDYGQGPGKGQGQSDGPKGDQAEDEGQDDLAEDDGDDGDDGDNADDGGDDGDDDGDDGDADGGPRDIHGDGAEGGNAGSGFNSTFELLTEAIADDGEGHTLDPTQALESAVNAATADDVARGEQNWRSPTPESDTIAVVETDARSVGPAKKYRAEIRAQVAVIKSRLRAKFLEAKTKRFVHGVRKGTAMSERRIVDSVIEIKSGRVPQRPDFQVELKSDPSLAVSVVLDESGSMNRLVKLVAKAAIGVADALDGLGCPVQVIGPRSGHDWVSDSTGCHRYQSVHIDVFKDWHEGMTKALPRFSHVRAEGSTPLEDGIQHALRELNGRSEAHRIILVITDGAPDNSNVVRRQIRLAKEAGIQIVGVAIGPSCHYSVKILFPDHILVGNDLEDLGVRLVSHLENVVFPRRAKSIKIDDPKTRLRSA